MLRSLLLWFLLLSTSLLIAACCVNNVCDCRDGADDAVYLKISLDSASGGTGYTYRQARQVYIRRQAVRMGPKDTAALPKPDSVLLTRTYAQLRDSIILSPTSLFTANGRRFDAHKYVVRLPAAPTTGRTSFVVSDLTVQGTFTETSGCCTCYENTKKLLSVNGTPYNFSAQPAAPTIVLKR